MNRKRAMITFTVVVLTVELLVINGLKILGADDETIGSVYVLLLCAAGLGVGEIVTRYRW
jgi:hypothetical protein